VRLNGLEECCVFWLVTGVEPSAVSRVGVLGVASAWGPTVFLG